MVVQRYDVQCDWYSQYCICSIHFFCDGGGGGGGLLTVQFNPVSVTNVNVPTIFTWLQVKGINIPGLTNPNFSYYIVDRSKRILNRVSKWSVECSSSSTCMLMLLLLIVVLNKFSLFYSLT